MPLNGEEIAAQGAVRHETQCSRNRLDEKSGVTSVGLDRSCCSLIVVGKQSEGEEEEGEGRTRRALVVQGCKEEEEDRRLYNGSFSLRTQLFLRKQPRHGTRVCTYVLI